MDHSCPRGLTQVSGGPSVGVPCGERCGGWRTGAVSWECGTVAREDGDGRWWFGQ